MTAEASAGVRPVRQRLSVDAIAATVLARVPRLPAADRPLSDCLGCVLAGPVVAPANLPPWPVATHDGYAVRAGDVALAKSAGRVRLRVIGEPSAVDPSRALSAGDAVRVVTGAPIPGGADAVVPAEWCQPDAAVADTRNPPVLGSAGREWVEVLRAVQPGQCVAVTGAEFEAGSLALAAGTVLGPAELAVLAALRYAHARVVPPARVALVATGTELSSEVGAPAAGPVYPSNLALMHGMVTACGAHVGSVRVASDDPDDLADALRDALAADLLLTTGGTGRSAKDLVSKVLQDQEADSLWDVPVRGSKPAAFRLLRHAPTGRLVPHLALPGRPIAAMVAFILFAYPLLRRLAGLPETRSRYRSARLATAIDGIPGRHRYIPVRLERFNNGWEAVPGGESSLYGLAATAGADGFAVLGRRTGRLARGHRVRVLLPPWSTDTAM